MTSIDTRTFGERMREIDVLLVEYERDIAAAHAWYAEWKARQSGFRCMRRSRQEVVVEVA